MVLACIPPPADGMRFVVDPPEKADVPGYALNSLGALAFPAFPSPGAAVATPTCLGGVFLAGLAAAQAEACRVEAMAAADGIGYYYTGGSPLGEELVATAYQYHGVRYRWAGMSSRGMDCSGLIARVLRTHGIRAPHNAAQLFQLGRPVAYEELQPGDLVFFKTSSRGISHVGMYIGNNKFIHASSGAGRVVTTSLSDPYYAARLKGARRLE